jgi:hypothetical protein
MATSKKSLSVFDFAVGISAIIACIAAVLVVPEVRQLVGLDTVKTIGTATEVTYKETPQATSKALCGSLKLDAVRPPAILENEVREYKLIGSGFCSDTSITISARAFVGNNLNNYPNSQPIKVSDDGTWMTVYMKPVSSPDQNGVYINVQNPNGNSASLFVGFQR